MNYETARAFADSWGLVFTFLLFAGLVGWCTFGGRATGCKTQCCNGGQSAESHCLLHVFLLVEILLCPS